MQKLLSLVTLLLLAISLHAAPPMMSEPSLSPDGSELAFVSGGDIWVAPAKGGDAHLLVSHPATESRPLYSPDGKKLAFVSDRTGNGDIYVLDLAGGALTRVTYDGGFEQLDAWSRDGEWLYYTSNVQDIAGMNDVFRVRATGGTPMAVTNERYTNEYFAAPAPDNKRLAFTGRGTGNAQWWRHGHSHLDESELWLLDAVDGTGQYKQLTPRGARHIWPMWSADGAKLFYMSDEGGSENLWTLELSSSKATKLTKFTTGRLLWPAISYAGDAIVFERDFGIWRFDTKTNAASPIALSLRGVAAGAAVEHRTFSGNVDDFSISKDGKKIAFIVRGEVFAAPASDATNSRRITNTPARESQVRWSPDGRKLVYVSERDGMLSLYQYDFGTGAETRITTSSKDDFAPHFSPDGKQLAYLRNGTELHVLTFGGPSETNDKVVVPNAMLDITPPLNDEETLAWSPDGKWIAYLANGERFFRNAWVVPADGGTPRQVSFLGNTGADTLSWTSDGRTLYYATGQRSEPGNIARVDLVPRVPKLREEQFRDLFKDEEKPKPEPAADKPADKPAEKPAEKKATEIVFDEINRRTRFLPVGLSVDAARVSPDGKQLTFLATAAGQTNLYLYSLDELAKEPAVAKQLTSTSGDKSHLQWSGDSKDIWLLDDNRPVRVTAEDGKTKSVATSAELDVDFDQEKGVMFREAWTWERDHFHDPKMNGADWNAVRAEIEPRVMAARTYDEVRRLLNLMVGELNASHLGARGPNGRNATGRIGLRFDRNAFEREGRFVITEVIPLSPAAVTRKIKAGDVLVAVDGTPLAKATNLERLLEYKVGKEVKLSLDSSGTRSDVSIQPVNAATEKGLIYRNWVERNRDYVRRISNGRVGYVHMIDMSSDSLAQLHVDLDAENQTRDAVVVDIRNNNGGFVNAYALDVFTRKPYLNMTFRDRPTATARTLLGQRALQRPTVLLTNQHSLSDAEDFSEGYHALGLGKVIGEPTAGWIIYTSNDDLVDGTSFRLPFITITNEKGEPMELHPRPVDVTVTRAFGEDAARMDSQLDAAVKTLMAK